MYFGLVCTLWVNGQQQGSLAAAFIDNVSEIHGAMLHSSLDALILIIVASIIIVSAFNATSGLSL